MKTKLFLLIFALIANISLSAQTSGTCGNNLTWNLINGVLTISGTGDMMNYASISSSTSTRAPWYSSRSDIAMVIINSGVTSIGSYAFYGCNGLTSVTISNSVTSIGDYAFYGCNSLTSISIPNSVIDIGNRAFYGCRGLTSVTIPDNVTSIGSEAFHYCSGLTFFTIPNNVTSIAAGAFSDCSGLTSVTIPNSVTSIENYAFSGCSGLTSVLIPDSVTNVGSYAFFNCSGLTSVSIGNNVTTIGTDAFYGCSGLTSVTIPNSVISIGIAAFYNCSGLTSVSIGNSVTVIGNNAFNNCTNLVSVELNSKSIVSAAYTTSSNFGTIFNSQVSEYIIGENISSIGDDAFASCSGLSSIVWNAVHCSDFSNSTHHPFFQIRSNITSFVFGDSVQHIPDYLCCGMANLTSIAIPCSVTSIGSNTFSDCTGLSSVSWNSVICSDFGWSGWSRHDCFVGCSNITSFVFGDSVQHIPAYLCSGMNRLTSITVPHSTTSVGSGAFSNCSGLTSLVWNAITCSDFDSAPFNSICSNITSFVFGDSVQHIPAYLCYGMNNLSSITIPNNAISIGKNAFYGCSGLTSVTIPNSVISVGGYAFYNCSGLASVTIGNNVTTIGTDAFYGCSGLTSVTIPNSVTSIGNSAFEQCSGLIRVNIDDIMAWCEISFDDEKSNPLSEAHHLFLNGTEITSLVIPYGVSSIKDNAFTGCEGLSLISIPNSVTSIGNGAFSNCSGLTSITIGNNVTSIGVSAFDNCSDITYVTIPNSVTNIGDFAFRNCNLISVTCEAMIPPSLGENVFKKSLATSIFVPCGTLQEYRSSGGSSGGPSSGWDSNYSGWKGYSTQLKYAPSPYRYNIELVVDDDRQGTATIISRPRTICDDSLTSIMATPNHGYHFVQWSDGSTDNPYLFQSVRDTVLKAMFEQTTFGSCGDSLYWSYSNNILSFFGGGNMYNYQVDSLPWLVLRDSVNDIVFTIDITSIGDNAFCNFTNLSHVVIPNRIISIGSSVFSGCSGLTSVEWNAITCSDFDSAPFNSICSNITSFVFGDSVRHIPANLCNGMNNLSTVTIPNGVTSIGNGAFYGCSRLDSVIWNARNCGDFSASPFNSSSNRLKAFLVGNSVQHIPANICNGMNRIKEVTIPASVETIDEDAFLGCDSLNKVDVYNLTTWCNTDFTNISCPLRTADLYINGAKPTRIDIPNGVVKVGDYTFINCKRVTEVTLSSSVTEIGENAFAGGSYLQTITLDDALVTIGDSAFASCPYLMTVNANMPFPPVINTSVFANCGLLSGIDCYVPQGSLALYRKTLVWADFNLHGTATDLQSTQAVNNATQTQKVFVDGHLYILLPDGTRYDATGKKVE